MARVFVIEDDAAAREALTALLARAGHAPLVPEGFRALARQVEAVSPDLVLLDLTLPVQDGVSLLRELRARDATARVPVICVTSRTDELDEVNAMGLGADDYVTKPFSPAVLLAHVEALLRRSANAAPVARLVAGKVSLDVASAELTGPAGTVGLTKNELRLLALLMRNAGAIVSRQALMAELWGQDAFVDDNTLTVNVNRLRRALGEVGCEGLLATHRGLGYSLEG